MAEQAAEKEKPEIPQDRYHAMKPAPQPLPDSETDVLSEYRRKVMTLLQFSRKAGKLIWGMEACKDKLGSLRVLLLTKDIAQNSRRKIAQMMLMEQKKPALFEYSTQSELSGALGLPFVSVLGVADRNFADKIAEYLTSIREMEER